MWSDEDSELDYMYDGEFDSYSDSDYLYDEDEGLYDSDSKIFLKPQALTRVSALKIGLILEIAID